jgi:hypothetical protein
VVQKLEIWVPQFILTKKVGIIIPTPQNLCQVSVGAINFWDPRFIKIDDPFFAAKDVKNQDATCKLTIVNLCNHDM